MEDDEEISNARLPSGDQADTSMEVTELLSSMTMACTNAAHQLREEMRTGIWQDSPVEYVIPSMKVSLKLALSSSGKRVTGVFKRNTEEQSAESVSQIDLELVAVPRRS